MPNRIIEGKKKENIFQLFFLEYEETKEFEVTKTDEISFEEATSHVEKGELTFITKKQRKKSKSDIFAYDMVKLLGISRN